MYLPGTQAVQASAFDAVEYMPAAHAAHELAPRREPLFVIEPAAQSMHDAMFDAVEYLPTPHAMHVVAPDDEPVFVIDPAAHSEQYDLPPSD